LCLKIGSRGFHILPWCCGSSIFSLAHNFRASSSKSNVEEDEEEEDEELAVLIFQKVKTAFKNFSRA
jgi:hypothetical protein